MDYVIHPYAGVEFSDGQRITFDMTTDDVSELLGEPDTVLPTEYHDICYHNAFDVVIHYELSDGPCAAVVVNPPSNAYLDRYSLLSRPYQDVKAYLDSRGGEVLDGAGQMYYLNSGVAIYENPPNVNACLLAFSRGYTDGWENEEEQIMQEVAEMPKLSEEERRAEIDELLHIDLDKFLES